MKKMIILIVLIVMVSCNPEDAIDVCQCTETVSLMVIKYDRGTLKHYEENKGNKIVPCQDERTWVEGNLKYTIECE